MESHEILRTAVDRVGAKKVAAALGVSTSLVYKWCEKAEETAGGSGARNPLDRLRLLYECTRDEDLVGWLCEAADGYFVRNPRVGLDDVTAGYVSHTQRILQEFSDLLQVMSASITDDGRIRRAWEELKHMGERFVRACEQGVFDGG